MTRKPLSPSNASSNRQQAPGPHVGLPLVTRSSQKRANPNLADTSQQQLCPQQRYVKRPKFPGMVTFDGGLRQLPLQGSKSEASAEAPNTAAMTIPESNNTEATEMSDTSGEDDSLSETSASASVRRASHSHTIKSKSTMNLTLPPSNSTSQDLSQSPFKDNIIQRNNRSNHYAKLVQMSAQLLRLEAMAIYTDLIRVNTCKGGPIIALPEYATNQDESTWKTLHGLRYALLPMSHDFSWASQSTEAPDHLRRLAARYGTTTKTAKTDIDGFMAPLYETDSSHWTQMLALIEKSRLLLEKFEKSFPFSGHDMKIANENLHQYLHALMDLGLDVAPCSYQCHSYTESDRWSSWRAFKVSAPNALNDDLREWHLRKYLTLEPLIADQVEISYAAVGLPLDDSMLCLLSGWLAFGPMIANSFHEFCKVFKFLSWVGHSN